MLHALTHYQPDPIPVGYNRFKLVATGVVGDESVSWPPRFCHWGQIGLGSNGNPVNYGTDYYTVEDYSYHYATVWSDYSNIDKWITGGDSSGEYTYNEGYKDDYYVEIIFTSNEYIIPYTIGFIGSGNQSNYPQRPEHFYLYGWNGSDWTLIIDVLGQDLDVSTDAAETLVTIGA